MKQIPLTPELISKIKSAVGEDVDTEGMAVFEVIALNTLPLPGKRGSIFERATVSYLTLRQMENSINGGNHLPLIANHNMDITPKGRVFASGLELAADGSAELRALFYLDPTEKTTAAKLNAGSLDEVSVQFLATQILCSECDFDYRGPDATWANFRDRSCNNGHTIGENGVHARLVGLDDFSELSLVTRGAANKPKIVGKSQSKLAPPLQALAARGFEVDELYLAASAGENEVDFDKIVAQLTEKAGEVATLNVSLTAVTAERDGLQVRLTTAEGRVAELEAASAVNTDATKLAGMEAELSDARAFLADVFTKLATATGDTAPKAPETIAELKAGIEKHQSSLTAILPVGGAAANTQTEKGKLGSKFNASTVAAFQVSR